MWNWFGRRLAALLWMGLALLGAHHVAVAQTTAQTAPDVSALLPADMFFRDPDLTEAVLSPSGQRVAVTMTIKGSRVGLFVIDLANDSKVNRVVQFVDADVRNAVWVNEDRLLFDARDYSEGSGRPDGAPGLFSVRHDGHELRMLIKRKRQFVTDGSMARQALEWNHRLLRVPAPREGVVNDDVVIGRLSLGGKGEAPEVYPLWLNTRTGRTGNINPNAPGPVYHWMFDSAGEPRVAFTRKDNRQAAYWRGPGHSEWQLLVEGDLISMPFNPHTVDDAGNLYVTLNQRSTGQRVLAAYDFERKAPKPEPLVVTPGFDFNGRLILERGTGAAQGVRVETDAEATVWLDASRKQLQETVNAFLRGRINRILSCSHCEQADRVALIRAFSDRDPGSLWIYRGQPKEGQQPWQLLARVREGVDPDQMATVSFERIKARDGLDLPVWLTKPKGLVPGVPAPTVVLIHGGPWVRGGHWAWNPMAQFLASRGYLVIEPEFRGSAGYGEVHFKAGWRQWGQAMQNDVADALLWARKQGLSNDKACIAGASYGGYSTLMGLVRQPELYRCGVAWAAVTDLPLFLQGSWWISDDISSLGRQYTLPQMVGDAERDAAMIAANSPVLLADRIKAPVLLAFGEADERVPLAHGKRMREALQKAGNEPEWVSYPGEGHASWLPKNKVDFAQRLERFLAEHLQ